MDYLTFCIIMGIMFWVLAALAAVCLIIMCFIRLQYYHWDKEQYKHDVVNKAVRVLSDTVVGEIKKNENDLGGGN